VAFDGLGNIVGVPRRRGGLDPERKENVVQAGLDEKENMLPRPVERKIWSEGHAKGHPPFVSCQDHMARLVSWKSSSYAVSVKHLYMIQEYVVFTLSCV